MDTLLIVDDEPALREILTLFLARQGYSVHTAAGGRECMELLQSLTPDLIVLDIMMQPMDGWDTLTAIRSNAAIRDLPVAMFSGKPPAPEDLRQYGGWIDDYLLKPQEFSKLSGLLSAIVLRSRNLHSEIRALKGAGKDPALIDEYAELKRRLYLCQKCSKAGPRAIPRISETTRTLEERLRCIAETLSQ